MRIALNIESIGARRGGAEKYAGTLARWLASLGHDVHVFARWVDPGELPLSVTLHAVEPLCTWRVAGLRSYFFARASERALRQHQFDVIVGFVKVWYQHAYLAVGGAHPASLELSGERFRSPTARFLWRLSKWLSPKQWMFRAIARKQFASGHVPHVIAPARMVAEHFQHYHHVPADRISVVYNGLDNLATPPDRAAARAAFRRTLGLAPRDVATLFVARNYSLKGLDPLLEAFAPVARRHAHARLVVCGNPRDARYRRRARQLGLEERVLFLGFVDDIRRCFAGCDLFAFPTFYDPCSLVVLEAMNAGLPVITTRQNGAGELLHEGADGFVVDSPWAIDQLSDRIERLVRDERLRQRMSDQARASVRGYTMGARNNELLAALAEAAGDPSAGPNLRHAA